MVVAAGSGTRLGSEEPKAFMALGGRPILERALERVFSMRSRVHAVVVVPAGRVADATRIARSAGGEGRFTVVVGGETRQRSVAAGLAALPVGASVVLVHDAARALAPASLMDAVVAAVETTGHGVIPTLSVTDTIKQADAAGTLQGTLDRSRLVAVQTPQGFPRDELVAAYRSATTEFTDDAALYAEAGHPVTVIAGDELAFKITTDADLRRARALLGAPAIATGVGVDAHAFANSVPLWLGGVHWPGERGLAAHSDGDVIVHAICDALLSAAGLGDLGSRFGTSEARFANAHGDVFIAEVLALITAAGYSVCNVSVQVIANKPKLADRRAELEARLTSLVGAPVSVAGTTSDGLGFAGRGEGIAAIATALIQSQR